MANNATGPLSEKVDHEKAMNLVPSQIASIGSLAKTREYLGKSMEPVGNDRIGQLSPSNTPGQPSPLRIPPAGGAAKRIAASVKAFPGRG